ncbi:hypothetical protein ABE530_19495 [Brucella sp. TWI559]
MPLIKLTRTMPTGTPVFINTENIAAIDTFGAITRVLINTAGADGQLVAIGGTEGIHTVAQIVNNAT